MQGAACEPHAPAVGGGEAAKPDRKGGLSPECRAVAPEKAATRPKLFPTPARIPGDNSVNGSHDDRRFEMRFLMSTLFGKSDTKSDELDAFMRRLDRVAAERNRPVSRRAAA
jgi:hypothetical protein